MSGEKPNVLRDLLQPLRNWRDMKPGVLVLPGVLLIFVGALAFILTSLYDISSVGLGVQIVLRILEVGFVIVGWAVAIFGFAAKEWPRRS